ncbi:MAG: hypothetical protein R6V02_08150 [Candidatus Aminicenantes bacterium]
MKIGRRDPARLPPPSSLPAGGAPSSRAALLADFEQGFHLSYDLLTE